jgi:anaerobic selenocysteine-containing dehydrogenase
LDRIYHPERLLSSQKRIDSRWLHIGAEQALDEIAGKLKKIVDQYGPRSVAAYAACGAHRTSAGGPWFISKWLEALGSPSFYTSFTIDSPSLLVAYFRLCGLRAGGTSGFSPGPVFLSGRRAGGCGR